uniref:Pyridoxal kinase n=1 Tax=Rhipicephalus appendiculatus TaxID=34631 RepID=A0A131Z5G5_RHIAP
MARDYRVLSIQSHVVSGYVGNKSACFPLQTLGFEVDFINSVQFTNHTGYPFCKGQVLNAEELQDLYDGLKLNRITKYSHVLTGYVGSDSFLNKVADIVQELKQENSSLMYVCDPVMGDNGKLYVPQSLVNIYKDRLVAMADVVTPNQYELELLSEKQITTESTVLEAMDVLHTKGIPIVVLTSYRPSDTAKEIYLYGSSKKGGQRSAVKIEIPAINAQFTGTGDLLAACILAWITRTNNLKEALEKAVATVQGVLLKTFKHASEKEKEKEGEAAAGAPPASESEGGPQPAAPAAAAAAAAALLELRLVQSKEHIENPHSDIRAIKIF